MKRLCADDSAATSVKVGYRQASYIEKPPLNDLSGVFRFGRSISRPGYPVLKQPIVV